MSLNIYDEIQKGSLSQFRNKTIINGLQRAAADALQSVYDESQQLRLLGDIDSMSGKNLDVIGERLGLKRTEAYLILRKTKEVIITDEVYRRCLKWKRLANNFQGTYAEIMESIRILWTTENIIYREYKEYPAHIFIEMPQLDVDTVDPWIGKAMALKPAGVALTFTSDFITSADESGIEIWENPHVIYLMNVYWSKAIVFDGQQDFDGEYTFFGWTYDLPVSMVLGSIEIDIQETIDCTASYVMKNSVTETVKSEHMNYLTENVFSEPVGASCINQLGIRLSVDAISGDGGVIIFKNKGFFDGEYSFDGTRDFDAYYKEEEY